MMKTTTSAIIDFADPTYLKTGSKEQREVYQLIGRILSGLDPYQPILAGTVPIGINIASSDLDIICCCSDLNAFESTLRHLFSEDRSFSIVRERDGNKVPCVRANFEVGATTRMWEVEIFGQDVPTTQQDAYLHMVIEHAVLQERGEKFRQDIVALKVQGMKTEPAFVQLLGLDRDDPGNPYAQLLDYGRAHGFIS